MEMIKNECFAVRLSHLQELCVLWSQAFVFSLWLHYVFSVTQGS